LILDEGFGFRGDGYVLGILLGDCDGCALPGYGLGDALDGLWAHDLAARGGNAQACALLWSYRFVFSSDSSYQGSKCRAAGYSHHPRS